MKRIKLYQFVLVFCSCFILICQLDAADSKPKSTAKAADPSIELWIKNLDDKSFKVREIATQKLIKTGPTITKQLQKVAADKNSSEETKNRCLDIIAVFEKTAVNKSIKASLAKWNFKKEHADIKRSIKEYKGPYSVEVLKEQPWNCKIVFQIKPKQEYTFKGHTGSNFVFIKPATIIHTVHHPMSSGCSLVAYNLKTQKQLWKANLTGLGPINHSKYFNQVNLVQSHPKYVTVYGQESAGTYIELVDVKTGKTIGHRKR